MAKFQSCQCPLPFPVRCLGQSVPQGRQAHAEGHHHPTPASDITRLAPLQLQPSPPPAAVLFATWLAHPQPIQKAGKPLAPFPPPLGPWQQKVNLTRGAPESEDNWGCDPRSNCWLKCRWRIHTRSPGQSPTWPSMPHHHSHHAAQSQRTPRIRQRFLQDAGETLAALKRLIASFELRTCSAG